jgi:hypothetical protein
LQAAQDLFNLHGAALGDGRGEWRLPAEQHMGRVSQSRALVASRQTSAATATP